MQMLFFPVATGILLTFLSAKTRAQSTPGNTIGLEISPVYGYHFASNTINKTGQSLSGHTFGLDFGLVKYGTKIPSFNANYGTLRQSLVVRIIQLNHTDTFGYSIGLLPQCQLHIAGNSKMKLTASTGFGVNFNTRTYSKEKNFDNRAISMPVNFAFDLGVLLDIKITPKVRIIAGSSLYHVSNGSIKMPNGGLNLALLKGGITWSPSQSGFPDATSKPSLKLPRSWYYSGYLAAGYRQIGYFEDLNSFWTFTLSNQYLYRVNKLLSTGAGIDLFYDASQELVNIQGKKLSAVIERNKYLAAAGISNRFDIGKLFIPASVYRYIYSMGRIGEPVYLRFGLGFQFSKTLYAGCFFKGTVDKELKLKSDFMEWAIGIRL